MNGTVKFFPTHNKLSSAKISTIFINKIIQELMKPVPEDQFVVLDATQIVALQNPASIFTDNNPSNYHHKTQQQQLQRQE